MRSGGFSEWREASRGCPQGSNLGPLLWNIFQNDLVQNIHAGRLAMYADDHQVGRRVAWSFFQVRTSTYDLET